MQLDIATVDTPAQPWAGRTPRRWQQEALPLVLSSIRARRRGLVSAIMGSGKSVLIARVCASGRGRVLLTVPTIKLVEQMAKTVAEQCPGEVGRYYTHAKDASRRITICCLPSLTELLNDPAWPGPPALWIADECHKESEELLAAHEAMAPLAAIGFTATPFKSKLTEELSLWDVKVYEYNAKQAMADGVVVPFDVRQWTGEACPLDDACVQMIAGVDGPGLVNAASIADAEGFAELLTLSGIPAAAVHSRQGRAAQAAVLASLAAGSIRAIVHVNMLSEGVDIPWLRWLCMRRDVGSRVRFCQEVGRVLRASPGKDRAVLLDPHDLFDSFGLTYEAVLSGSAREKEPGNGLDEARSEATGSAPETEEQWVQARAAWRLYVRRLYLAALSSGAVEQKLTSTHWRKREPTAPQLATVHRALAGLDRDVTVPPEHRRLMRVIGDNAGELMRGDLSDLMSVGFALRDGRLSGASPWDRIFAAAASEACCG